MLPVDVLAAGRTHTTSVEKDNLQLTYFIGVYNDGHTYGEDPQHYAEAIRSIDKQLGLIALAPRDGKSGRGDDWSIMALIDHGHVGLLLPEGRGHGFRDLDEFRVADVVTGSRGNDELHGGRGPDCFAFTSKCGTDLIEDFNTAKDAILIDTDLAGNRKQVRRAAQDYGDGVVIELSKDATIKIEGVELSEFKKIDLLFYDI